jgi:hypothetical protein
MEVQARNLQPLDLPEARFPWKNGAPHCFLRHEMI